jgi:uncharacterized cofD-like protein
LFSPIRIVSIGGGTGLSRLLQGLKKNVYNARSPAASSPPSHPSYPTIQDLTAIVTVTDDGGSSGQLREDFQILPPGDIRKCLVALSEDELLMSQLFQYRFEGEGTLQGHNFGNLILTAMTNVTGDFLEAIRLSSEVLAIKGRILPSTMSDVRLVAQLENGATLLGESLIGRTPARIQKISLYPEDCLPLSESLEAIGLADIITLGPGSLFTSLLPNLLVQDICEAIKSSTATKIYIMNIMTQIGETLGYTASDHLKALQNHCGHDLFDIVLCNQTPIRNIQQQKYATESAAQIIMDWDTLRQHLVKIVLKDLLSEDEKVRHDPLKLSQAIFEIWLSQKYPSSIPILWKSV